MTAEKDKITGAWIISDILHGYLVRRVYYGYTKREAIALFKKRDIEREQAMNANNYTMHSLREAIRILQESPLWVRYSLRVRAAMARELASILYNN